MRWIVLGALTACISVAQAESVMVRRPAELRQMPGDGSRNLAALPAQTPVTRLGERQGPWVQVRTPQGLTGWLHMFDIVLPGGSSAQGGKLATGALRSLSSLLNKGSTQAPARATATSTLGIRGLGDEDLAQAQPNLGAVGQVQAWRLDAEQARQFAASASLASQAVEPLPEPPAPRAQRGSSSPHPDMQP
ncbi:MAG: SH3 domain-containing protein [Burkholderiaceae bacterium]